MIPVHAEPVSVESLRRISDRNGGTGNRSFEREAVLGQPSVVVDGFHVADTGVGEDGRDDLFGMHRRIPFRCRERGT